MSPVPASFLPSSSSSPRFTPNHDAHILIPGLPNDIASQIPTMVPYSHHPRIKPTSKSCYAFLSSQPLIPLRLLLRHVTHLLCIFPQDPSIFSPYLFDTRSLAWCPLPPYALQPTRLRPLQLHLRAGGESRHALFGAAGSRMRSVERYDVGRDEWVAVEYYKYYKDAVVMDGGGKWREVGDMWGDGERGRLGKIVVV